MKLEIKTRWVQALRSGKYQQSQEALKTDTGYCCLGVLCDIVKDEIGIDWESHVRTDGMIKYITSSFDGSFEFLPDSVVSYTEVDSNNPKVIDGFRFVYFSSLNDGGVDFSVIADTIEEYM